MRKLAKVVLIDDILPHNNADSLEIAVWGGWRVVVKKGEFKKGQKVVAFEIDSFLPVKPEYEFLRKFCFRSTTHLGDGFRLKAIKLRGEYSMGLIMPLGQLASLDLNVDDDLTELLNVKKWEPPIPTSLSGHPKGSFPYFIRKTDQERIQNCSKDMKNLEIEYNNGQPITWYMEEKMDGSSCTIYFHNGEVGVCSRNLELKLDDEANKDNAYILAATREGYLDALKSLELEIAIQAELCGPGIQGNIYNLNTFTLFVFDIWNITEQRYATRKERDEYLNLIRKRGVNVQEVPKLGKISFFNYLEEALKIADNNSQVNPKVLREGVVFKSEHPIGVGGIKSFKVVSNKFLIKNPEN